MGNETNALEFEQALQRYLESARESEDQPGPGRTDTEALIDELNRLYTPILVANDITARVTDDPATPQGGNVIKFDPATRKAQLISVCARLISKYRNDPDYQIYVQASRAAQASKLKMQKDQHAASIALADEYLSRLAATASDGDASRAAQSLAAIKVT